MSKGWAFIVIWALIWIGGVVAAATNTPWWVYLTTTATVAAFIVPLAWHHR